jgi:hypothetical protein
MSTERLTLHGLPPAAEIRQRANGPVRQFDDYEMPERPKSRFGPDFKVSSITTTKDCIDAIDELDRERLSIQSQLDEAYRKRSEDGIDSDGKWLIAAKTALKYRSMTRQRLQEQMGILRKQESEEKRLRDAETDLPKKVVWEFYKEAKEKLPPELFNEIEAAAMRRAMRLVSD